MRFLLLSNLFKKKNDKTKKDNNAKGSDAR